MSSCLICWCEVPASWTDQVHLGSGKQNACGETMNMWMVIQKNKHIILQYVTYVTHITSSHNGCIACIWNRLKKIHYMYDTNKKSTKPKNIKTQKIRKHYIYLKLFKYYMLINLIIWSHFDLLWMLYIGEQHETWKLSFHILLPWLNISGTSGTCGNNLKYVEIWE